MQMDYFLSAAPRARLIFLLRLYLWQTRGLGVKSLSAFVFSPSFRQSENGQRKQLSGGLHPISPALMAS